jgi:hypothetical protein
MQSIEFLEPRVAPATFVVTSLADSGKGTLREAIAESNDKAGADIIVFEQGLSGTIMLSSGQIAIADTLTIKGPGADKITIDANRLSRIFSVTDLNAETDSAFTVSGLTFFRGQGPATDGSGGAIACFESLNVRNCRFLQNSADAQGGRVTTVGGAIFANFQERDGLPTSVDIRGSVFGGGFGDDGGGAVNAIVHGNVTLKNNSFTTNLSDGEGGAVVLKAGAGRQLLVDGCQFLGNSGTRGGGAVLIGNDSDGDSIVIVRGSLFSANEASSMFLGDGGGLFLDGGKVIVERSAFLQNDAARSGGGLAADKCSSLVICGSQMIGNRVSVSSDGGGGIHLNMPEAEMRSRIAASIVSGNVATQRGGILVKDGAGRLDVVGSRIAGNHAELDGGGIMVQESTGDRQGADLKIFRSKLTGNDSRSGGGVAVFGDGGFVMQFSQIIENQASFGGGVFLSKTTLASISGSVVARNIAVNGGGIEALSALNIRTSKILGNSASNLGGGIESESDLTLKLCTISKNSAPGGSGIFLFQSAVLTLKGCKVAANFGFTGEQIEEA